MYTEDESDILRAEWMSLITLCKKNPEGAEQVSEAILWAASELDRAYQALAFAMTFLDEVSSRADKIDKAFQEFQRVNIVSGVNNV